MTRHGSGRPRPHHRRGNGIRFLLAATLAAIAVLAGACSRSEESRRTSTTTTTERPPASTRPTLPPAGDQGGDAPLPVAWVTQVGGPGADTLAGAAGRNDAVVAVGSTQGITPPTSLRTEALVAVLDAASGALRSTTQQGSDRAVTARAVASATTTGLTLTCGATDGSLSVPNAGAGDAWCAPITPTGAIDPAAQSGGEADDGLDAVAITDDGAHGYAAGTSSSLFPGAQDPTGGYLGGGDALVVRLDQGGRLQWARQFGTSGADSADGVATTDDGDAIVTGTTDGSTDSESLGGTDGWISRMDPYGNQRWLTQFGTAAADRARSVAVGGDPRRGTETFVAVGSTEGDAGGRASGGTDAMIGAFDASGKQAWLAQLGSTGADSATGVVVDGSTVYVAGTAAAPVTGAERIPLTPAPADDNSATTAPPTAPPTTTPGPTGRDGFLAALDASTGEVRWVAQFGSAGNEDVTGLTRTETGLLVVSGTTDGQVGATPSAGVTDGFLVAFRLPAAGGGAASVV